MCLFLWGQDSPAGRICFPCPVSCSFPAAGGAAVVFFVVQESLQSCKKGDQAGRGCGRQPSDLFGFAALVPRASSVQTIFSTPYFIMLDAFHPVLHPGGKQRALAFLFAEFKGGVVEGCPSVGVSCMFSEPACPDPRKTPQPPQSLRSTRVLLTF